MKKEKVRLGEKVKDIVSGFTGIATCRLEYLNGCVRYTVTAKKQKDNNVPQMDVDVEQIVKVDSGVLKKKKITGTGGEKMTAVTSALN